jgi:hypothetical protein
MLNAILLVLSGDATEANKQVAKIESSPVKGMLAAEVAVASRAASGSGLALESLPSFLGPCDFGQRGQSACFRFEVIAGAGRLRCCREAIRATW